MVVLLLMLLGEMTVRMRVMKPRSSVRLQLRGRWMMMRGVVVAHELIREDMPSPIRMELTRDAKVMSEAWE